MAGKSGRSIENVPASPWKNTIMSWEGMLIIVFVLVNFMCASMSDTYLIANIFREMPRYLAGVFLLLPMTYILILGEIDISVGSIVCLSATAMCMAVNNGLPTIAVFGTGLLVGTICGFINGIILTKFTELPPMIVTLATQIIFRGIAEIWLGSGGSISLSETDGFRMLSEKVGIIPYMFFLIIVLAILFWLVLSKSTFGRRLYAIGANPLAAYYSGVPVQKIRLIVFTVTGFMAGVSAMFLTSVLYGANTTTGNGFELDAIAMAVFGGVSTAGGKGKIEGGMISAFIIICLRIGLGQINMNPQLILIILGSLLIVSALLPNILNTYKMKKKRVIA